MPHLVEKKKKREKIKKVRIKSRRAASCHSRSSLLHADAAPVEKKRKKEKNGKTKK
jgi:hypothetical protein